MAVNPQDPTTPTEASLAAQAADEIAGLKAYMQGTHNYVGDFTLIGGVVSQTGDIIWSAAPTRVGCLLCNGQAVSRTTYANLLFVIGIAFGPGNGTTTFNVPDLAGRTMFGYDAGNTTGRLTAASTGGISANGVGNSGGTQNHIMTTAELVAHSHGVTVTDPGHSHATATGIFLGAGGAFNPGAGNPGAYGQGNNITTSASTTGITATAASVGSSTAFNTTPPGLVLYPFIKI